MAPLSREALEEAVEVVEARASVDPEYRQAIIRDPLAALSSVLPVKSINEELLTIVRHTPPFQLRGGFPQRSESERRRAEMDRAASILFS